MKIAMIVLAMMVGLYSFMSILWVYYLAMMNLKRVGKSDISTAAKAFGYPALIIGLVMDVLFNWLVGTVMFLELPKETVFTSRLTRWHDSSGWRGKIARWFAHNFLDQYDPKSPHVPGKGHE